MSHLTLEERKKIESLLDENKSGCEIAKAINRSAQTISNEIDRGGGIRKYKAELAHENYQKTLFDANNSRPSSKMLKRILNIENALRKIIAQCGLEEFHFEDEGFENVE